MNICTFATTETANVEFLNGLKVGDKVVETYRPRGIVSTGYKKIGDIAYRIGTIEKATKSKVVVNFGTYSTEYRRADGRQAEKDTSRFPMNHHIVSIESMNEYAKAIKTA